MLKRFTTHTLMALAEASLVALLVVGLIAGTAFAARGGGGKPGSGGGGSTSYTGTLSLATPLVSDANGNGLPNRGDVVTFDISTSSSAPFVQLECFQGSKLVLMGRKGYFEGSLDTNWNFGLSSGVWPSGSAADCTASLVFSTKRGWSKYASTGFHVDP